MNKLFSLLLFFLVPGVGSDAKAQNFRAKQKSQERVIKSAFKQGKITAREYDKLMNEQQIIRATLSKYEADKLLTPHEKNVLHDKLVRAEKRLRRYKTNGEVY